MLKKTSKGDACTHDVYIKGLCGNCGARLDPPQSTSVSMIHSVPELKVSEGYAQKLGKADQERLIQDRKLVLLVDLDQTILHTTHEEVKNDPQVYSFTLWPGHPTYHTKLRPHMQEFLESMSKIYELHIFTFGCRRYAHKIASIIDPDQKYFGTRILSRDESVDQFSKKGNLNNLFPCGDAMVCIIDDRADVWRDAGNLIQVKPYSYFKTSISDGAQRISKAEDEALERDADKLEALLALDDDDEDEVKARSVEEEGKVGIGEPKADSNHSKVDSNESQEGPCDSQESPIEVSDDDESDDSCEGNLRKKKKVSDSDSDNESETGNCDENEHSIKDDILDGSNKDENEKEVEEESQSHIEDPDDHLLFLPNILGRIHDKWYMELDEQRRFLVDGESYKLPDIKDIIKRYLRKKF